MRWLERVREIFVTEALGEGAGAMQSEIEKWGRLYRQGSASGTGRLRLPSAIASELARLAVCELETSIEGGERARYLQAQYAKAVDKLRVWAEYGFALGGMALKVRPNGDGLAVECIPADCFTPLEWGCDGEVTAAEFSEQAFSGGKSYRRVERHSFDDGRYVITNRAYDRLGREISLAELPRWADLAASVTLEGIRRPLFVCFSTPMANRIDKGSPLGMSVYAGAAELIEQAERQWERIEWEYKGGELAVDASEDLFEHRRDGSVVLPEGSERLFRAHDIDIGQSGGRFLEVFSPELRDVSLFNGFNNILRRIEFNCGLAYGSISDLSVVERTAQEIKAGKQRSYSTVCDLQAALEKTLRGLTEVLDIWATLGGLCGEGDWELRLCWGDSIVGDSETLRQHHRLDVAAGLMTAKEYREFWYGKKGAAD